MWRFCLIPTEAGTRADNTVMLGRCDRADTNVMMREVDEHAGQSALRRLSFGAILVCVLYVPFLAKPVHIDDGNFIRMAQAIDSPLGVKAGSRIAFGGRVNDHFNPYLSTHPPGIPLFLKIAAALAGGYREIPLHATFLLFPMLLAFAVSRLARSVGVEAPLAMLAVLGSAAVLPAGHNLMADLPATALWTVSVASWLQARDGCGERWAVVGAVTAACACLASYQMAFLVPLILLMMQRSEGKRDGFGRVLLWVGVPLAVLAALLGGLALRGTFPHLAALTEVTNGLTRSRLIDKLVSLPIFLGLATLPFLPWSAAGAWRRRWPMVVAVGWFAGVETFLLRSGYSVAGSVWLGMLAAAGVFGVAAAFDRVRSLADKGLRRLMLAWMVAVPCFAITIMPFGACRYLMPIFPPLLVLLLASIRNVRYRVAIAVLSAILGLGIAVADYQFAVAYRSFAKEVAASVGPSRDRVWYVGDWGMNYYFDESGFRYLASNSNEPRPGDLVIFAEVPRTWNPSPELRSRLELIDVSEAKAQWPIHVMNQKTHAGYYSSLWGYYPFVWSRDPIERFGVFRVKS